MKSRSAFVLMVLAAVGVSSIAWAQTSAHKMFTPGDLKWTDVAALPAGAKMAMLEGKLEDAAPFTFRAKLPANYQLPAHWHPAIEHVTVISGTFNLGLGDKLDKTRTKPLSAGSFTFMPPKTNHFGWTEQETVIQIHGVGPWGINYVNAADDPRKKQQ
ncbi:MAG TPA: cupin domain-containing protein [Steroidobacteraceae bacterium]|nr:cupin domain-containing protein [Steroidobacteraceae bacterium]